MIWMEYCDIGDLDHYMRNKKPSIDEIIFIMKQLCDAVKYIHSKCVTHRDIKPANVLFCNKFLSYPRVKLADFGIGNFAGTISHFERIYFNTPAGTLSYTAPEVHNRQPYKNSADIYSMGRVLEYLVHYTSTLFNRQQYNKTFVSIH